MEIETRKRAAKYIVEMLKMKEDRWPKVCLREEIRAIINRNPSQWGRERVEMEGSTDIIGRRTETKRRTGHTRRLGESG